MSTRNVTLFYAAAVLGLLLAVLRVINGIHRVKLEGLGQEIAQLRRENTLLKNETQVLRSARAPTSAAVKDNNSAVAHVGSESSAQSRARVTDSAPTHAAPLLPGMIAASEWRNMGRATPEAAFQTELWAEDRQQIDVAATAIAFEPAAREKLEALLAGLPKEAQLEYGTPEKLAALLMTGGGDPTAFAGMRVLESISHGVDETTLRTQWQYADGQVRENAWQFRREPDGWKRVLSAAFVDKLVRVYRQQPQRSSLVPK